MVQAKHRAKPVDLTLPLHPAIDLSPTDPILNRHIPRGLAATPWPARDWDALDDMLPRWSYAAFKDALKNGADVLHRDIYSVKKHLAAWQVTEDLHQWARVNNPSYPRDFGLFLYSGPMGQGKSLSMAAIAWLHWINGVPLISNMSLRFGYQVSGAAIYSAIERAEPGSLIVLDEVAALMDPYSGGSNRGRTVSQSLTAFRKKMLLLLCGSANEQGIHPDIRRNTNAIIGPHRYNPLKRLDSGALVPARAGELPYPKFTYMQHIALIEPWEGVRVLDDAVRVQLDEREPKKVKNPYRGKWRAYTESHPGVYNLAALCSDTLDRVPAADNLDILRDQMTADRAAIRAGLGAAAARDAGRIPTWRELQKAPDVGGFLRRWVADENDFRPGGIEVTYKRMQEVAERKGIRFTQKAIKDFLESVGIKLGRTGIQLSALLAWAD